MYYPQAPTKMQVDYYSCWNLRGEEGSPDETSFTGKHVHSPVSNLDNFLKLAVLFNH
ncbi:hypothetical protein G7B40_019605 [Aetokthonos hydrillicola Thurmond2011]|jgi:hypothetical protein|uniref:Uncharacterized protein n=1 Tax=Aetokthonos hydrillicola Thurmond2011 TaxID=2712845 RepID=A0AAP5I834_9CYAN|nr:hypothetical protein [Aetokthonos hydrillicola Thurmond2011]